MLNSCRSSHTRSRYVYLVHQQEQADVLWFDSKNSTKCFGDAKGLKFSRSLIGPSALGWVVTRTNMDLEVLLLSVRKVARDFYTDPCN